MTPVTWPCPSSDGGISHEMAVTFDDFRRFRLLIIPALFDEANKLRRFTIEVMRRLNAAGIDCILPDLPGCNESLHPLETQTPDSWCLATVAAAKHFRASHVLTIRGGGLFMPDGLSGWHYAPQNGANVLRTMLRGRIMASREAGLAETQEGLLAEGFENGLELAGYRLGAEFLRQFQSLAVSPKANVSQIDQDMLGGSGLWLRAEPSDDSMQADALAAILAIGIKA